MKPRSAGSRNGMSRDRGSGTGVSEKEQKGKKAVTAGMQAGLSSARLARVETGAASSGAAESAVKGGGGVSV